MGFFVSKFFWGTLLIGWGLVLIVEKLLKVSIPYGRFILAFVLIYAGIYLITKHSSHKRIVIEKNTNKAETVSESADQREYNLTFGENIIDLSSFTDYSKRIIINTIFGTTDVYLSENEAYNISVNTVFGKTMLPPDKAVNMGFGSNNYTVGDDSKENKINIEINTIFGNTSIMIKR